MKKLSLVLIASFLIGQNAFARHSYRSEVCSNSKYSFVYTGNSPIGGYYQLAKKSALDMAVEAVENNTDIYSGDEIGNMVNFEIEKVHNLISYSKKAKECDSFDSETSIKIMKIKISNLADDQAKVLGLKNGDSLTLHCKEVFDLPNEACAE